MKLSRIFHIPTNKTHHIYHVWSSSCEIHETTHNLFVLSLVHLNATFIHHELKARDNWIMNKITFVHSKSFQHLQCILLLSDKNTIRSLQDFKTKEISHLTKIYHVKLIIHGIFKLYKHQFIISSKKEIINIKTYN